MEGVGDHGCEYMTGGCVAIIGRTGRNFAAGMSGGVAYVLDEKHDLYLRVNKQLVDIEPLSSEHDTETLKTMLQKHCAETGSAKAKEILDGFDRYIPLFKKIIPRDFRDMIDLIASFEAQNMSREEAELAAFRAFAEGR